MRLPPRGSAQDDLLLILHNRQREAKFTELAVLVGCMAVPEELRTKLLNIYREELFEDAYKPAIIRGRRALLRQKEQAQVDAEQLLAKVGKLTVPNPEPPKKGGRKK